MICGVIELSNEGAHAHGFQSRGQVSALLGGDTDAGTVRLFCCGDGREGSPACYTNCVLWRAQRDAEHAARRGPDALVDAAHRDLSYVDRLGELAAAMQEG